MVVLQYLPALKDLPWFFSLSSMIQVACPWSAVAVVHEPTHGEAGWWQNQGSPYMQLWWWLHEDVAGHTREQQLWDSYQGSCFLCYFHLPVLKSCDWSPRSAQRSCPFQLKPTICPKGEVESGLECGRSKTQKTKIIMHELRLEQTFKTCRCYTKFHRIELKHCVGEMWLTEIFTNSGLSWE